MLLLLSASATTDIRFKAFDCALVSTLETYDKPENGYYLYYIYCIYVCDILSFIYFYIAIFIL